MGPMARKDLREDLHEQVEKSVQNGAQILCGGKVPDGEGYFYPATVLENVSPGQPADDDELFGQSLHSFVPKTPTTRCGSPMTASSAWAAAS